MQLVEELRDAIDSGHLVLHYQPQLDLRTRRDPGGRGPGPLGAPAARAGPPDKFLPLAEEAGLMRKITAWVLETAAGPVRGLAGVGPAASAVAVNISPTNLLEPGFVDTGRAACSTSTDCRRRRLVLEITETSVISEFETARQVIEELRESRAHRLHRRLRRRGHLAGLP